MPILKPKLCLSLRTMLVLVPCCAALFLAWRMIADNDPIERAVRELRFQNDEGRRAAAERLKEGGPEAMVVVVPALTEAVGDADGRVRLEAVRSLDYLIRRWVVALRSKGVSAPPSIPAPVPGSVMAPGTVVPALVKAMKDGDRPVRLAAIDALGLLTPGEAPAALPALLGALQAGKDDERAHAAAALGTAGAGSEEAKQALAAATHDPNAQVRAEAARALTSFFEDPAVALRVLEILEQEPDDELRERAFRAFAQMPHQHEVAERAVPLVLRSLRSRNNLRRLSALATLEQADLRASESQTVVPVLIETLERGALPLRPAAAAALGHLGTAAAPALPALEAAMTDPSDGLRDAAKKASTRIKKALGTASVSHGHAARTVRLDPVP